ncbi:hypothetical protein [Georgenia sp. H159]|uniref:hypothetical protein n=1 Tax=Georgenia sp. H159 TaxID=3076115 RepID=UPI002D78F026|nr:hypothetical protein [Georgenia sp. H159]
MDVWRITVATLRRWYIFLPLLALTAGAVYAAGAGVQPEYEVSGSALITPGRTQSPVPNPYGGEQQASSAVAIVLNSTDVRTRVQEEGLVPDYEVSGQSRSTILSVTVRGESSDQAVATAQHVFELAVEELQDRQTNAGMPPSTQYGLDILAAPSLTNVVYDGKMQVQAVVGLLGASLAVLVAVLFDDIVGLYRRRRARRLAKQDDLEATEGAADWQPDESPDSGDEELELRPRDRDHAHA